MNRKKIVAFAVAAVVVALLGAWLGLKYYLQRQVHRNIEKLERDSGGALKLRVGDVSVNPILQQATLSDLTIDIRGAAGTSNTVHADSLKVLRWKRLPGGSSFLRELTLEWRGVKFPQLDWQLAKAPAEVKQLIGETALFDISHTSVYRPESQHESDLDVSISSARLGNLGLHVALSGIDFKALGEAGREQPARGSGGMANPQAQIPVQAALAQAQVRGASFSLRNSGLFEALVAMRAATEGRPSADTRRAMRDELRASCDKAAEGTWMRRVCPAGLAFVQDPKSLRLTLQPTTPVMLAELASGGPDVAVQRLNLSLVANQEK